jgi:hypothetical protein
MSNPMGLFSSVLLYIGCVESMNLAVVIDQDHVSYNVSQRCVITVSAFAPSENST